MVKSDKPTRPPRGMSPPVTYIDDFAFSQYQIVSSFYTNAVDWDSLHKSLKDQSN